MKMLTGVMLQPLLQQMFKVADTSPQMSSSYIRQSPYRQHCLLYARPARPHSDASAVVFQQFQKPVEVVFLYPFVANSFTDLLAPNLQTGKLIHVLKIQNVILFAQTHFRD